MEGFTAICVWFLAICAVIELAWKGWHKYQETIVKPKKDLEEEKKNKD